ncbi:MAG: flavodoxin-dependent (E)-4-hydroxy-3-methylbut-2-enyl-diphosphate synthase [Candidatus Omnitrophota bacterium]
MTPSISRKKTCLVKIGSVKVGKNAPVSVQSMAKTDTRNVNATVKQIKQLEKAGCEIIRVAVKDIRSAKAIKAIKRKIKIPLEADIHFDYRLALESVKSGADAIRINPGNIKKKEDLIKVIEACKRKKIPIRIGLNSGSAGTQTAQGLVKMAKAYIKLFEQQRFYDIMISLKASDVYTTIDAYRKMALVCDYPFHLGITATGTGNDAIIKSAIGIGTLLAEGIGDTIRVSLTDSPLEEIKVARQILQALGLRRFYPEVISCPTCGRCQVDLVKMVNEFSKKLKAHSSQHTAAKFFPKIALMGCEVNGPGEAKEADIGIAFGKNSGILFKKGKIIKKVSAKDAIKELIKNI